MIVDPAHAYLHKSAGTETLHLSDAGGLVQFGAYVETLLPGEYTSYRHWHSAEDEFLFMLDGTATVIDDDGAQDIGPGDAACWPHGAPNAHHLQNRTGQPIRYIIAGSRAAGDICHYPDDGRRQINTGSQWQVVGADGSVLRQGDLPPELLNLPAPWGKAFDAGQPGRRILRAGSVTPISGTAGGNGFGDLGAYRAEPISDEGGLTQFGAFTETLMPGAQSSQRHWHRDEDEFLFTLSGVVTLVEDDGPHNLPPGSCACWPKGMANAHCLQNRTDSPVTYLIIGTRWPTDDCTYPDIDLHYSRRGGWRHLTRKDGTPLPGWPKEIDR